MKIGILTFHFARNYGAVLQCYALQRFLEDSGHQVQVIDYRPESLTKGYKVFDIKRFWGITPGKFYRKTSTELKVYQYRKARYQKFEDFVGSRLNLTSPVKGVDEFRADDFDLLIVGSDQVWNTRLTEGYDNMYWGKYRAQPERLVSYAASGEDGFAASDQARQLLDAFTFISVREKSLADKMKALLQKEVYPVSDPTLLLRPEKWGELAENPGIDEPYLLYYQVRKSPYALEQARQVAQERGLKFICLSAKSEDENSPEVASLSPEEFVGLFNNATYVVTTSFHGTAFSIIFGKDFLSADTTDGKGTRQKDLLSELGLEDRLCYETRVAETARRSGSPAIPADVYANMLDRSRKYLEMCTL